VCFDVATRQAPATVIAGGTSQRQQLLSAVRAGAIIDFAFVDRSATVLAFDRSFFECAATIIAKTCHHKKPFEPIGLGCRVLDRW
jgi:hypothetical protein